MNEHELKSVSKHTTTIPGLGKSLSFYAVCSCGWTGPLCTVRVNAERTYDEHRGAAS